MTTTDDFIAALLAGVDAPTRPQPRRGVASDADTAELMAALRGAELPTPTWPPAGFVPASWEHPVSAWTYRLMEHAKALPSEVVHFPEQFDVQQIEHRGVRHSILLLGLRVMTGSSATSAGRVPKVADGAWGGCIELDGKDLLDERRRWAAGDDGGRAAVLVHEKGAASTVTTFVVAITPVEGMLIKRFVVGRDCEIVTGSTEEWVVEGGQVRRVEQPAASSPLLAGRGGAGDQGRAARPAIERSWPGSSTS